MKNILLATNEIKAEEIKYKELSSFIENEKKIAQHIRNRDVDNLLYIEPEFEKLKDRYRNETYMGIFCNDVMIGYYAYGENAPHWLQKLYITPSYRRKGIAAKVIDEANFSVVDVLKTNKAAIAFYESLGFEIDEEYKTNYQFRLVRK